MRKRITYSTRPTHRARAAHAKGDRQFRHYDTSQFQPKKSKAPIVVGIILAILVIAGGIWAFTTFFGEKDNTLASGETVQVIIPEGAGGREIGALLQEKKVVASSGEFVNRINALSVGADLRPGTYEFTGPVTLDEVINQLKIGPNTLQESFTIPEGFTLEKIGDAVADAYPSITKEAFLASAKNAQQFVADYPFVSGAYDNSLEGFLFPKTYPIEKEATADSVIRQMLDQYKAETSALNYSYPESQGLSPYQVLILASVVEREAAADNKPAVASVFYNRLAIDMALQSDATTAYVIGGDPTPEDLQIEGPYNTYLNKGLPAGPICSPGLDSLQAVCKPDETSYYYFYFREENGKMAYYFSETYDAHNDAIFS